VDPPPDRSLCGEPRKFSAALADDLIEYGEAFFARPAKGGKGKPIGRPPALTAHIWDAFLDLLNPAGVGMGPVRITYEEIDAYRRVTRRQIGRREADLIIELSENYVLAMSRRRPGAPGADNFRAADTSDPDSMRQLLGARKVVIDRSKLKS
jgi:hypothetical protein